MKIAKRLKNKRGFTLVELLVAMVIMGIVTSSLSVVLTSTFNLYYRNETTTVLFNVSQKLHIAINSELASCKDMTVYTPDDTVNIIKFDDYQAYVFVNSEGMLLKNSDKGNNQHLLLSEKSYHGARIKSISYKIATVTECLTYDDNTGSTLAPRKRLLYVTTVLAKGTVEYEHTSAVRLYNMQLWGSEINVANNHAATSTFDKVVFHYSQYYSVNN